MPVQGLMLVAGDYLESKILQSLGESLFSECQIWPVFNWGRSPKPDPGNTIENEVKQSDCVLVAMSESSKDEVRVGALAVMHGKPLVCSALGYRAWENKAFEELRAHVRLLFVLDEDEARCASALFPAAQIVAVGNPEWEGFGTPSRPRDEVRNILRIKPEEKLVLVSGEKQLRTNLPLAACVIEGLSMLPDRSRYRVIFTIHPGHAELRDINILELYRKELVDYYPPVRVEVSCTVDPFGIGTPDMVAGADVVIGTNSTVQIQAAFMRIPTIAVLLHPAFAGRPLPLQRREWWTPVEKGAIGGVYDLSASALANQVEMLLAPGGFEPMRYAQEKYFKPLARGEACASMRHHILAL